MNILRIELRDVYGPQIELFAQLRPSGPRGITW